MKKEEIKVIIHWSESSVINDAFNKSGGPIEKTIPLSDAEELLSSASFFAPDIGKGYHKTYISIITESGVYQDRLDLDKGFTSIERHLDKWLISKIEPLKPEDIIISTNYEKKHSFSTPKKVVRIIHKPTGLWSERSSERSEAANTQKAMIDLKEKIANWDGVQNVKMPPGFNLKMVIQRLDFKLLAKQKEYLANLNDDNAEGVLNFLESLCDAIVNDNLVQEEVVYSEVITNE